MAGQTVNTLFNHRTPMNDHSHTMRHHLHNLCTALIRSAQKGDASKIRSRCLQLETWVLRHAAAKTPTAQDTEIEELLHKLRSSKAVFDSTVSAYKDLLDSFDTFRTTIEEIHRVKRFDDLPAAMQAVGRLHDLSCLHLVLDTDSFAHRIPSGIGQAPSQELRHVLCQFTPAPHTHRLYLGTVQGVEHLEFFLGQSPAPDTGSCFIFALHHKYLPGVAIGTLAGFDPDPTRFAQNMATDFLGHFCDILSCTLINALEHDQLEELTVRDALTGINNRAYLERHAPRILDFSVRRSFPVHLLFIDLDGFKSVNDTLGHDAGDRLLIHIAQTISPIVRRYDIFVRLGGDEFVVVLPDTDQAMAQIFVERILEHLAAIDVGAVCGVPAALTVSASIGMACYQPGQTLEELLRAADQQMYEHKTKTRQQR
ncbi:hypothetical protein MASR1M90_01920 [Desulfovibrionales bacterium]